MTKIYDAIVIGGGQSGLAAGFYLQKWGADFLILESASQATGSWEHHYDSLHLFSPAKYSSLPDFPFAGSQKRYPNKREVVAYLPAFQERFQLPVMTNSSVLSVVKQNGIFTIETNGATYKARSLISATGGFRNPFTPQIRGEQLFLGQTLHSFAYKNSEPFVGKRVVVVGAGNSAIQIANELADTAVVTLATRDPIRFQKQRVLGKDIHFWAKWTGLDWLPKQNIPKRVPVIDSAHFQEALQGGKFDEKVMFTSFDEDGVVWADGQREVVDVVIFATGYRPNVDYLAGLAVLDENGRIQHQKGVSKTTPGLYFVGIPFQRNLASATLRGAGPDAKFVVHHLRKTGLVPLKKSTQSNSFWQMAREKYCTVFCPPTNIVGSE